MTTDGPASDHPSPAQPMRLALPDGREVSALLDCPRAARAAFVFAHGAGAGMTHPFMTGFAEGLCARDVAVMRFQFPFMENGLHRTDTPAVAHATVRAAVEAAARAFDGVPLFAGGKSFGGRMTSQAQAEAPLPHVAGLVFVGFPLHAAKKPATARGSHLADVDCPMLFLQGTRDDLADLALLTPLVGALGTRATLRVFDDADHAFHVRVRSGTNDVAVRERMLDATAQFMAQSIAQRTAAPRRDAAPGPEAPPNPERIDP